MKRLTRISRAAAALIVGLLCTSTVFAQTATTATTLSSAVTSITANQIVVASATGFTAGTTMAYVDRELLQVTAVSGTTISVIRGSGGTAAVAHLSGAVVYVSVPQTFTSVDPYGACTASAYAYLPVINITTGGAWYCNALSTTTAYWGAYGGGMPAENRTPHTSYVLAGTTQSLRLTDVTVGITTTSTGSGGTAGPATTLVLPTVGPGVTGKRITIIDESGGLTATTFVGLWGTVNGVANGPTARLTTAYQSITLQAGTNGWIITACYRCGAN